MFERWNDETLKFLAEGAYNGLVTPMPATEKHIRACYAHMDAQQAVITEAKAALATAHEVFGFESDRLGAEIERLKGELEAANTQTLMTKTMLEQSQSDLAAHALALKEAREALDRLKVWLPDHGPAKTLVDKVLARPLSSYQQRAERLEAVAKAARGIDEAMFEQVPRGLVVLQNALSDLDKE